MTAEFKPAEYRILTVERQRTAVIPASVRMNQIPEVQRSLWFKIAAILPALDAGPVGRAFTLWRPPVDGMLDMEPGVIVSRLFESKGEVVASALPAGRAAHFQLVGLYDGLPRTLGGAAGLVRGAEGEARRRQLGNLQRLRRRPLEGRNLPLRVARLSRRNVPLAAVGRSTGYGRASFDRIATTS